LAPKSIFFSKTNSRWPLGTTYTWRSGGRGKYRKKQWGAAEEKKDKELSWKYSKGFNSRINKEGEKSSER